MASTATLAFRLGGWLFRVCGIDSLLHFQCRPPSKKRPFFCPKFGVHYTLVLRRNWNFYGSDRTRSGITMMTSQIAAPNGKKECSKNYINVSGVLPQMKT